MQLSLFPSNLHCLSYIQWQPWEKQTANLLLDNHLDDDFLLLETNIRKLYH